MRGKEKVGRERRKMEGFKRIPYNNVPAELSWNFQIGINRKYLFGMWCDKFLEEINGVQVWV